MLPQQLCENQDGGLISTYPPSELSAALFTAIISSIRPAEDRGHS